MTPFFFFKNLLLKLEKENSKTIQKQLGSDHVIIERLAGAIHDNDLTKILAVTPSFEVYENKDEIKAPQHKLTA